VAGLTSTPGLIVGGAVGGAAAAALAPALEVPRQEAWKRNTVKVLPVAQIAALIAQGGIPLDKNAQDDAHREGLSDEKLDALIYLSQTVPGISEALAMYRRGFINQTDWEFVLQKSALRSEFWGNSDKPTYGYAALKEGERLGLGDLAYAVVRGIVPSPDWVPVAPPTSGDYVKRFPQVNLEAKPYAAQLGFNEDHLKMMVGRSGLSMAPVMAANALFRTEGADRYSKLPAIKGVSPLNLPLFVGPNDFLLAIAEGDLRTEWGDAVEKVSREILTASQYAELELRGFLTTDQRRALTALHGMSDGNSDLLYNVLGRSIPVHQITTGEARGGTYNGPIRDIPDPYLHALQRESLRPEYYNLAYANRYTLPSGFQIKAETQSGDITQAESKQLLLESGWQPHWAEVFSTSWATPKASSSASHVSKAQTQLWGTLHKAYLNHHVTDADARTALIAAGVPVSQIRQVLTLWQAERDLTRRELTVKQILGAPSTDPRYGTDAQKQIALQNLGFSPEDILVLLGE